jgi:hypothetical protein
MARLPAAIGKSPWFNEVGFGAETSIDAHAVMENRRRKHRQALIAINIGATSEAD